MDHKKIAKVYIISAFVFLVLGLTEALLMRLQMARPLNDVVSAETYNQLFTMHGTTMIFFVAIPLLFGLMNAIVPLQIGARDVSFPFLNALGLWLYILGGIFLNTSWILGGAPDSGWTAYASLAMTSQSHGTEFYSIGLQIAGLGTLIGAINFIATIFNMRAPGMALLKMPMFTWATLVSSGLLLFAMPPLTVGLAMQTMDRLFGTNFFDVVNGGNTIIWEHLFWIFGHPEVYVLVLPAFGIYSEIIATFSRKRLFGYYSMVFALVLIGFLGFMVWAHHMFTVGLGPAANAIFAIATMAIAIPTGIKIFNWLATMWGGKITFTVPMLYAVGFIPIFVLGGMTGVMLASAPADFQYHDTYFVVAHFHYVIVGGVLFAILGGLTFYWPKLFGKKLNEAMGKITFVGVFVGFNMTFFLLHFLGLMGMPRRVAYFLPNQGFDLYSLISACGAVILVASLVSFIVNIMITSFKAQKCEADTWGDGRTLEWAISSPPPEYNFKQIPQVRGIDALWYEKMNGDGQMMPAEALSDIHMPDNTILPLVMSLGFFIAGYGLLYINDYELFSHISIGIGSLLVVGSMLIRSVKDYSGFYIRVDELGGRN